MAGLVQGYLEMQRKRQLRWQVIDVLVGAVGVWILWDQFGRTTGLVFAVVWGALVLVGTGVLLAHWLRQRRLQ